MLGMQALHLFNRVYAIPFLLILCYSISTSVFKHVYNIGIVATTILCMVNLQLGYQPANHYILDLRPEYGDDIVEIASAIFQSFTYQLPFLKKTKRRLRRGQTKRFIKKRGWRLHMVHPRRKTCRRNICKTHIVDSNPTILLQDLPLQAVPEFVSAEYFTKCTVSCEAFAVAGSTEETDVISDDIMPLEFKQRSTFLASVSDEILIPEAQLPVTS